MLQSTFQHSMVDVPEKQLPATALFVNCFHSSFLIHPRTSIGVHTASNCTRSNLAVYSCTASSPRARTSSTIGETCSLMRGYGLDGTDDAMQCWNGFR